MEFLNTKNNNKNQKQMTYNKKKKSANHACFVKKWKR